ncbi:hypothetical protein [Paraburkholderia sp.]|uniref:hypothetical protein n=1 Tax=Paraburkholderia sp. TaxID=1926495 RepID=UPI0025E26465|nr:hypothetical protein [Paraburkholderia sp.]
MNGPRTVCVQSRAGFIRCIARAAKRAPDKSFAQLHQLLADGTPDIPAPFGDACREELESLRAQQF